MLISGSLTAPEEALVVVQFSLDRACFKAREACLGGFSKSFGCFLLL